MKTTFAQEPGRLTPLPDKLTPSVESRVGKVDFDKGLPTQKGIEQLFEIQDFQRATQLYQWAIPAIGVMGWHKANIANGQTGDTDWVVYDDYVPRQGILLDFWQRPIPVDGGKFFGDVGLPGPDAGKGGKFLPLPPPGTTDASSVATGEGKNAGQEIKEWQAIMDHLRRLPIKNKGELPVIPVDERAAEVRAIKVG